MDKSTLRRYARGLRKNGTDAERHLWYHLRANRFGYKFKRQVPIKHFIVDFVCLEKRLIVGILEVIRQALSPTLSRELAQYTAHLPVAGEGADRSI